MGIGKKNGNEESKTISHTTECTWQKANGHPTLERSGGKKHVLSYLKCCATLVLFALSTIYIVLLHYVNSLTTAYVLKI
jgi:hypothetical protein